MANHFSRQKNVRVFPHFLDLLHGSENPQRIIVDKCLNVDLATIIGVPEIAGLGCEFDIAGYVPEAIGNNYPCTDSIRS